MPMMMWGDGGCDNANAQMPNALRRGLEIRNNTESH